MKKLLLLLSLAVIFVTSSAQNYENVKGSKNCSERKMQNKHLAEKNLKSTQATHHSFDVLNYKIDIDLVNNFASPYPKDFRASVVINFRADSTIDNIVLNAVNSSLTIDSVRLNAVSFSHTGNLLKINLDKTYLAGEEASVKIYYNHNNVSDGAFYASGGFIFTDCEPEGARRWLPCYDKPSDKATTDITAKVPSTVRLGSNGRLQDSIVDGNNLIYHWVSRDPVSTYLIVLTAKVNYKLDIVNWVSPSTGNTVPIRFYYNANENPSNIKSIIGDLTTFYSDKFGEHPFEKNGFATLNSQFAWGGMENQTLTSLCPGCWSESLVAHEFAHQWFGDMITCDTWADIFLNEGFATYLESLWWEHRYGYSQYKNDVDANASTYLSGNPGWAISNPAWAVTTPGTNTLFNYAITYCKGASVLHMLRYVMGDEPFFKALKAYATNPDLKYSTAKIEDFKNVIENSSGQELDRFFDQWIYKPNHPSYENTYSFSKNGESQWTVFFKASQTATSSGTYWQMPLELKISLSNGADTLIRVFNNVNNQNFTFDFKSEPVALVFDPYNHIVLKTGLTSVGIEKNEDAAGIISITASPVPFGQSATLTYSIAKPGKVKIGLYDFTGRMVSTVFEGFSSAGTHSLNIESLKLESGSYFAVIEAGGYSRSAKLVKTQ